MDSSDFSYDIMITLDGSVDDMSLPAGSLGDLLNGVLRLPAVLFRTLGYVLEDFGS
jgi:hypothetical protein